jgi:hypothetical protein
MPALPRRLLAAALLLACGPGPADTDAGSTGDPTTSTSTTTEVPTTGEPFIPAVCDAPASDIDPFPDPATCDDFPGSVGDAELEIGIVNLRSEPVFVHGNVDAIGRRVLLAGELGGRAVSAPYVCDDDPPPCEDLIAGGLGGCKLIGIIPTVLVLEPGARYKMHWAPYIKFPVLLPAACQPAPVGDQTCTTSRPPPPGAYTLSIRYAETCAGSCTCELAADGGCKFEAALDTTFSEPITVEAAYDGVCAVVDIVIE